MPRVPEFKREERRPVACISAGDSAPNARTVSVKFSERSAHTSPSVNGRGDAPSMSVNPYRAATAAATST